MSLNRNQIRTMLTMQSSMNAKINAAWVSAKYPFLRAVGREAAEAIDFTGWKWWSHTQPNVPQLGLELVDIWHFAISEELMRSDGNVGETVEVLAQKLVAINRNVTIEFDKRYYHLVAMPTIAKLELMMGMSVSRRFSIELFDSLLSDCAMDWAALYRGYVAKNTLNFFRQDNGYNIDAYSKIWAGREDNEHLLEIADLLDPEDPGFSQKLYDGLNVRYTALCKQ